MLYLYHKLKNQKRKGENDMLYDYDLEQSEVDHDLVNNLGQEAIQMEISEYWIVDLFQDEAQERIDTAVNQFADEEELNDEEREELIDEALKEDTEEVALEIAKDFVKMLIDDIEMTKDRLEDSLYNLNALV